MAKGDRFTMALAHTLNLDGTPDTGFYSQVFMVLWGYYMAYLCLF